MKTQKRTNLKKNNRNIDLKKREYLNGCFLFCLFGGDVYE